MTPSTPPGDWEVDAIINDVTSHWREDGRQGERGGIVFLDELREKLRARLREREAAAFDREAGTSDALDTAIFQRNEQRARAEAAEAALEREATQRIKDCEDRNAYKRRMDIAEARVRELENAWDKGAELDEAYLARIAELKATLRNIRQAAHDQFKDEQERGWISASWVADRCQVALAHEEEAR